MSQGQGHFDAQVAAMGRDTFVVVRPGEHVAQGPREQIVPLPTEDIDSEHVREMRVKEGYRGHHGGDERGVDVRLRVGVIRSPGRGSMPAGVRLSRTSSSNIGAAVGDPSTSERAGIAPERV